MTPWLAGSARGQSTVESLLLGLLFLVPIIWLLGVLADVHRAALASTTAAREAGFEAGRSSTYADARREVAQAIEESFVNHGLEPARAEVALEASGLERGGMIEVEVEYPVTILQAPFLGRIAGPSVWIRARHVAVVDPYRSKP